MSRAFLANFDMCNAPSIIPNPKLQVALQIEGQSMAVRRWIGATLCFGPVCYLRAFPDGSRSSSCFLQASGQFDVHF